VTEPGGCLDALFGIAVGVMAGSVLAGIVLFFV
jgi:hypothetical protein